MPVPSLDQIKQRESTLRKLIADQNGSLDPVKRREAKKKLRRVQRRRRSFVQQAERRAAQAKKPEPAKSAEAPAGTKDEAAE